MDEIFSMGLRKLRFKIIRLRFSVSSKLDSFFPTCLIKLRSKNMFEESRCGFLFWLRFSMSSKMDSVFSHRPQKTQIEDFFKKFTNFAFELRSKMDSVFSNRPQKTEI